MAVSVKDKHGAMALLVLFLAVSAATGATAAAGPSSRTCSMAKEELEDCRGKIFKSFQDQSQSSLTLEDPQAVQRCCDQIQAAEQGCVHRVCPASLPDEVCPAILGNVCPAGGNGPVNDTASSASPLLLQQVSAAFLTQLLCFLVAYQIFRTA